MHFLILSSIMLLGGILGGIINYFLNKHDSENKNTLFEYTIFGIGAALLVPLFLNMISSDLIMQSEKSFYNFFVILGFCLIAAISSKAFIRSLTDRVFREAKEAKKLSIASSDRIEKVQEELDPLIRKNIEKDPEDEDQLLSISDTEDDQIKVLIALNHPDYTYRSIVGVMKDSNLHGDRSKIRSILSNLQKEGYAKEIDKGKGPRYYLTANGLQKLKDEKSNLALAADS